MYTTLAVMRHHNICWIGYSACGWYITPAIVISFSDDYLLVNTFCWNMNLYFTYFKYMYKRIFLQKYIENESHI